MLYLLTHTQTYTQSYTYQDIFHSTGQKYCLGICNLEFVKVYLFKYNAKQQNREKY